MRPPIGIGTIGDGSSLVPPPPVEGGWLLSTEVSPMDPLCPVLIYAVAKREEFSPLPEEPWCLLSSPPERYLPQTMHQRLYQWPDSGVGPHVTAGGVVKDFPPKELPPVMEPWVMPLPPTVSVFDPVAKNWDSMSRIDSPKAPPAMYADQGFHAERTIRKDNPHFAYSLLGGWIGNSSQDASFVSGLTLDATGAPLGGCTVILLDADRLASNPDPFSNPVLGTTTSHATTGAYSFKVRGGRNHQVIAYLPGSPDVAGVTRRDVQSVTT